MTDRCADEGEIVLSNDHAAAKLLLESVRALNRHVCLAEMENLEGAQGRQLIQPGIGHLRIEKIEPLQAGEAGEIRQAGVFERRES